jgi:hypothetical protein
MDEAEVKSRLASGLPVIVNDVLYNDNNRVAAWVNLRLGCPAVEVPFVALGIPSPEADYDEILSGDDISFATSGLAGGAYYHSEIDRPMHGGQRWKEVSVTVAIDDRKAISKHVILRLLEYPFVQLGCQAIRAEIAASNEGAIKQAEEIGFEVVGVYGPQNGEVTIMVLTPEGCQIWQKLKNAA